MKFKYYLLIFLSCSLTFITQSLYHYYPTSDSVRYLTLAKQYNEYIFFDPITNCYGHPFYALFLAIIGGAFSYHYYVIGFIQTLIFCLSVFYVIKQAEIYMNKNLTALMIFLFFIPEIYFFNGYILTESLAFSLMLFVFGLALKIYNSEARWPDVVLLSLICGMTIINRMECSVIIFPVIFLIYPRIKHKFVLHILTLISIPAFLLIINGMRNYAIYHVYKVTAFNGGEVIYGGNSENLDGSHHVFDNHKEIFIPKDKIEVLDSIQSLPAWYLYPKRDSLYLSLAVEAWQKDPIAQLGVIPVKFAKDWLLPGIFDVYTSDTTKARGLQLSKIFDKKYFNNRWYAPYKHLLYLVIHWLLLLMLILGISKRDRHNRFQMAVLVLMMLFVLFAIPFCGLPRWHVTIFPLLIIAFTPQRFVRWLDKTLNGFKNNISGTLIKNL